MKILNISLKNFKSYGEEEYYFDLSDNTSRLFVGENGQGKSSVIDAILWSLYGKTPGTVESVVNRINKKNCKVEINFQIDKNIYSVIRYRKHEENGKSILIFKNTKNISPTKPGDCQKLIEEIIGINYDAMVSSVVFSAELYTSFLRARGSDRLRVIDNILNLKNIHKWADTTKKLKKPITEDIEAMTLKIEKIETGIETINENIETYKQTSKNKIIQFKKDKEKKEENIKQLEEKLIKLKKINFIKELKYIEDYDEIEEHNDKISKEIINEKLKLKGTEVLYVNLAIDKQKLIEYEKINIEESKKVLLDNEKYNNEIKILKEKIKDRTSLKSIINSLEEKIKKLKKDIEILKKNICPLCGSSLKDSKKLLSDKEEILSESKKSLNEDNEKLFIIETENEIYTDKISNLKKKIQQEGTHSLKELETIGHKITTLKLDISLAEKDAENFSSNNKDILERIDKLEITKKDTKPCSKYNKEYLENIEKASITTEEEIEKLKEEIKNIGTLAKSIYDKSYVEDLEEKKNKLKIVLKKESKLLKIKKIEEGGFIRLLQILSNRDGGIKKFIISKMINKFNEHIGYYAPLFFNYKVDITFDKNLNETILVKNEEVEFETFSSGEKARFEIAIAFSLFMLVKKFFSSSVSFIVFDEILDNNLDDEGIKRILSIISSLEEDNSIIVISHREEYKDFFQNKFLIFKNHKGFSVIKEL